MLASDVMDESRVLLNDTSGNLYTNTILLAPLVKAWLELQNKLISIGVPYPQAISAPITVAAGGLTLTLPADFVLPIQLKEKGAGETYYTLMTERMWEPDDTQQNELGYWAFRDGAINFRGATSIRNVKLYYYKSLAAITAAGSTVPYPQLKSALASRTAAIASEFIGGNKSRGDSLNADAFANLNMVTVGMVKEQQGFPIRRRPYKWRSKVRRGYSGLV